MGGSSEEDLGALQATVRTWLLNKIREPLERFEQRSDCFYFNILKASFWHYVENRLQCRKPGRRLAVAVVQVRDDDGSDQVSNTACSTKWSDFMICFESRDSRISEQMEVT